ncbi:MAG: hypothetical protein M1829_002979 [Trizodia sp. TS-e1964]|nr:MAG: hypothetical protein M1829_002979 [Trizodia sp. TS-e1964]
MSSDQSPSTGDLRGAAVDYNRFQGQKAKWALGERESDALGAKVAPFHHKQAMRAAHHREVGKDKAKQSHTGGLTRKHDIIRETSGYNLNESYNEPPPTAPDAEITYSYDAPSGPARGSQILGLALASAVQRFEGRETEKLVREEYEVVGPDQDDPPITGKQRGNPTVETDDDDYELV